MAASEPAAALRQRFASIRVVNLAYRTDRLREVGGELAKLGLAFGDGVTARFDAVRPNDAGAFPTIGARGCFLSQLGVLREARDAGAETVLLLEDDVAFDAAQCAALPAVLTALDARDWAIVYGGSDVPGEPRDGLVEVAAETEILLAHFIAFRRAAIVALVPYLEAMLARPADSPAGGPMHVDGAYNWFRRDHPALRTFAAKPGIAHQRASRTDIHALRTIDRVPVVRDAVQLLRRLKRRR